MYTIYTHTGRRESPGLLLASRAREGGKAAGRKGHRIQEIFPLWSAASVSLYGNISEGHARGSSRKGRRGYLEFQGRFFIAPESVRAALQVVVGVGWVMGRGGKVNFMIGFSFMS